MEFIFNFKEQEINIILEALAKEQYLKVANLITNIHQQAKEQMSKTTEKTVLEETK